MRAHLRSAAARLDMAFTRCYTLAKLAFGRVHANIGHELMGTIEALIVSDLACDN